MQVYSPRFRVLGLGLGLMVLVEDFAELHRSGVGCGPAFGRLGFRVRGPGENSGSCKGKMEVMLGEPLWVCIKP